MQSFKKFYNGLNYRNLCHLNFLKMSDDFVQFNLDRPPKADVKSNEQMHCHSVGKAEDYPPLEKAVFILMIGEEIQKLSVIQNIPELIKEDYEGCLSKIIPKMNQGLVQGSIEYHLAASKSVQKILKQNTIQPVHFKVNFLKTVLKSMDNRDPDTAKTWLDTLLEAIKILKEDVIIEDILPVAESKSRHTEPVFHRVMSCRMLGRIAEYCSTYTVQKSVLGVVQALCQDVDKSVRAAMCFQLPQLTRPLLASYDRDLLPLLNDCVNDEQIEVRAAAYCALVQSLALVNQDILKQSFLPMAKKIIEQCLQTVQDGIFLIDLTEQYGNLCLGLEPVMNEPDKIWFAEAYLKLADLASSVQMKFKERVMDRGRLHAQSRSPHNNSIFVDSRVNCALNMPNIIRFCRGIGNSNAAYFTRNIYPLMCMLCSDSQYAVRRAIASVMHEIAATLGKTNGFIQKEFIKLLNDDSEDVLQALIPNIKKCLESFCDSENFSPEVVDDKSIELTRSLFACESEVLATYNWRLQTEFFKQLEVLMRCLPSSFVYSQFVTLLRKRLFTYRTVECRVAIVRTLLVFLRYNTNMSQRNDLRNSIITDLCCSKNFYNRSIYVRSIPNILEIFSSAYFRSHFFSPTIALMEDKVANIRFMMCDLMPMLKCIAAHDKNNGKYSALVEAAIEKTNSERDRLVLEHIATMNKMLDKVKLDENDSAKIKEEKLLDALAANAKDVKSHFANLNTRAAPMRNPPRTFDVRDVRSLSSRSLVDSRHGDSSHLQQQLTLDCSTPVSNQTPSPAGTASSQLSPDIIAYDIFPKFHQTYSNNNGAASNDFPPNSNFQNVEQIPSYEAARCDLATNLNFQNYYQLTSNETARKDSPPNSNFQNLHQFPSHEADRNNDIIPNLNFPSFNHVPCSEAVGNDLVPDLSSPNPDQISLNNNGLSKNDLTQNPSHFPFDGKSRNDLEQNVTEATPSGTARDDFAHHFNQISSNGTAMNDSVTNSNFTNSNQIPTNQVTGNHSTQHSNLNKIPTNVITRNNYALSPSNARCMSPDIIKNSKSSFIGNLPDIALNHAPNSPELHVNNEGLAKIGGYSDENYHSNSGHVVENPSIVYLEEVFSEIPHETHDSKNNLLSKHQSPDSLEGFSIQRNETKNLFVRRSSLGYLEERLNETNDSKNSIMDGKPSTEFLEGFSNQNKKSNKFVRNSSMIYSEESFDHKSYDFHQRHETCHNHNGKGSETSMYSKNNISRSNEIYDSNMIEGETTRNPPDNAFLPLNKTFEPRHGVQNLNQNLSTSINSRKFKINSSNLLNNNFETTAPATYTYSYINENSTSSSLSDNLEIDSSNLQNNNLETPMSIYNYSNTIETENSSNRIEDTNFNTRYTLENSSILINESTPSDIRNLEYGHEIVENKVFIVDIDEGIPLENDETTLLQTNKAHESNSSLSPQNNFSDNLDIKHDTSAEIVVENITSEDGSHETLFELDKNNVNSSSDSKVNVQSSKECYLHTTSILKVLDNKLIFDDKTEHNTTKETSHVLDIGSNHVISEDFSSVPNLDNNVESIVNSKSENNVIEKQQIKTDQSSLIIGDSLPNDHHKVSDVNKSHAKSSKIISSGIPTISKSPRRSLVLDSECTSIKSSIPSMNARRSLVFDSTSIPSIKKSQRNSLNFDCEYASGNLSTRNKSPKSSSVFGNDHNDPNNSAENIISKLESTNCFGIVKSGRSNDKVSLGSQKGEEARKLYESSVFKGSNEKTTFQACLQKTGELGKSSQSLVLKRSVDDISYESSQSSDKSRKSSKSLVSKLLKKKSTGEGFDGVKEPIKASESPILERSSGKMSKNYLPSAEEPKAVSGRVDSKPFNDKTSEDVLQKAEEPKNPSKTALSKIEMCKMSADIFLKVDESKKHSESHVSKVLTDKLSEADPFKVEEPKKLLKIPSPKLETHKISEKINIKKSESPQKSSKTPVSKPSSVQVPQKSFLPIRASKNAQNFEITSGESQVTINSKRHSLGALSTDNDAVISKQLSRKSAGRPQSLVINSSRLPVRSGTSSTSSLGISRTPR